MKLAIISDTHLEEVSIPEVDVLLHCGDLLRGGSAEELMASLPWLNYLRTRCAEFLFVPGNHDSIFERNPVNCEAALKVLNIHLLIDREIIIDGVKFYGSPWQPDFFDWAFNLPRGLFLQQKWAQIPNDTDVLITHGPPYSILDLTGNKNVGCEDLYTRVFEVSPRLHCFGHIHASYGMTNISDIQFVNASICNEEYHAVNSPICWEI